MVGVKTEPAHNYLSTKHYYVIVHCDFCLDFTRMLELLFWELRTGGTTLISEFRSSVDVAYYIAVVLTYQHIYSFIMSLFKCNLIHRGAGV